MLFMWVVLPAYGAASYVPAIVLERPLFVRCDRLARPAGGVGFPGRLQAGWRKRRCQPLGNSKLPARRTRQRFCPSPPPPNNRERNDGLYRVITYLVAKMTEELGIALINSIVFGERDGPRSMAALQLGLGSDYLTVLEAAANLLLTPLSLPSPYPCITANIVFWAVGLQGSFAVFWAVYAVTLFCGIGEQGRLWAEGRARVEQCAAAVGANVPSSALCTFLPYICHLVANIRLGVCPRHLPLPSSSSRPAVLAYTIAAISPNMDVANAALPAYVTVSMPSCCNKPRCLASCRCDPCRVLCCPSRWASRCGREAQMGKEEALAGGPPLYPPPCRCSSSLPACSSAGQTSPSTGAGLPTSTSCGEWMAATISSFDRAGPAVNNTCQ